MILVGPEKPSAAATVMFYMQKALPVHNEL